MGPSVSPLGMTTAARLLPTLDAWSVRTSLTGSGPAQALLPMRLRSSGNRASYARQPNKRLKLAGGDRFKGSGVLCAGAHELSFTYKAHGGRVARSLSAIR